MAEKTTEKSVTVDDGKTPEIEVNERSSNELSSTATEVDSDKTIAPEKDKTVAPAETPDADDLEEVISLLNIMDENNGGKGGITEIPDALRGSIKYLVEQLTFIKNLFEDPMWKAILDDLADQKEDGKTPSVEVAIVRNIPMEKIQSLSESEDYEGVQGELTNNLAMQKQTEDEDAEYEANFIESQKAGEAYAKKMGYDEARKNELFQKVIDLLKIMGDGILTEAEFADVDKMLNYDSDTESLKEQISTQDAKEVLPDKSSVDAALSASQAKSIPSTQKTGPGMGSMADYEGGVDITQIGKRKRQGG